MDAQAGAAREAAALLAAAAQQRLALSEPGEALRNGSGAAGATAAASTQAPAGKGDAAAAAGGVGDRTQAQAGLSGQCHGMCSTEQGSVDTAAQLVAAMHAAVDGVLQRKGA
jgi:hypothetical protein